MESLLYLLVAILVFVFAPPLKAKSSRTYLFGLVILLGGGMIGSYYYFHKPVELQDYQSAEITYGQVFYKQTANKLVLVAGDKEYYIAIPFLEFSGQKDFTDVLKKLSSASKAKIWIDEENFIKGIESDNLNISPEVGVAKDNKSLKGMAKVGWFPAVLGLLVILFHFVANYLKRNVRAK